MFVSALCALFLFQPGNSTLFRIDNGGLGIEIRGNFAYLYHTRGDSKAYFLETNGVYRPIGSTRSGALTFALVGTPPRAPEIYNYNLDEDTHLDDLVIEEGDDSWTLDTSGNPFRLIGKRVVSVDPEPPPVVEVEEPPVVVGGPSLLWPNKRTDIPRRQGVGHRVDRKWLDSKLRNWNPTPVSREQALSVLDERLERHLRSNNIVHPLAAYHENLERYHQLKTRLVSFRDLLLLERQRPGFAKTEAERLREEEAHIRALLPVWKRVTPATGVSFAGYSGQDMEIAPHLDEITRKRYLEALPRDSDARRAVRLRFEKLEKWGRTSTWESMRPGSNRTLEEHHGALLARIDELNMVANGEVLAAAETTHQELMAVLKNLDTMAHESGDWYRNPRSLTFSHLINNVEPEPEFNASRARRLIKAALLTIENELRQAGPGDASFFSSANVTYKSLEVHVAEETYGVGAQELTVAGVLLFVQVDIRPKGSFRDAPSDSLRTSAATLWEDIQGLLDGSSEPKTACNDCIVIDGVRYNLYYVSDEQNWPDEENPYEQLLTRKSPRNIASSFGWRLPSQEDLQRFVSYLRENDDMAGRFKGKQIYVDGVPTQKFKLRALKIRNNLGLRSQLVDRGDGAYFIFLVD